MEDIRIQKLNEIRAKITFDTKAFKDAIEPRINYGRLEFDYLGHTFFIAKDVYLDFKTGSKITDLKEAIISLSYKIRF